ncbi:N-acetylglutamate synthase [Mytilinidion resinicola]|uniref:Amino-acid acetyltransferase, mitochondrial n=1 Tax=Mytilinidion resinicola TaxID=574789 RepID=A0A6A6Y0R2_9PEZI|nr:N-acetylglutamate synthase [Mytilinidion resinicola]KAF2801397.1 N-acetylglutamate synthase [Mytilinidion resinicola]
MNIRCKAQLRGLGTRKLTTHCRTPTPTRQYPNTYSRSLHFSSSDGASVPARDENDSLLTPPTKVLKPAFQRRADRDWMVTHLEESPARRDSRNYLKHFKQKKAVSRTSDSLQNTAGNVNQDSWRLHKTGVNLGNLYAPAKAIEESPTFTREAPSERISQTVEPLHIALVKLRWPQGLDKETLGGIALTLSQLVRLGLNIALVLDCDGEEVAEGLEWDKSWATTVTEQANRVLDALLEFNEPGAMVVDHALGVEDVKNEVPTTVHVRGGIEVKHNRLLLPLLEDGIIPVIPPIAYTTENFRKQRIEPDDVVLALTREFAGITARNMKTSEIHTMPLHLKALNVQDQPLLDRILILDPVGGIPSKDRPDNAHVFINLEQEYRGVRNELTGVHTSPKKTGPASLFGGSNPFSKFVESNINFAQTTPNRHTKNLDVVQRALKLLPPSSSALIITPHAAAVSSRPQPDDETAPTGVRTRRPKNPLIHNLLTDKPMVSSSLPDETVPHHRPRIITANPPTFVKKGIPVTIIPAAPWAPRSPSNPCITLENDPRIDFPRLIDLIDDSFQRKLDVHAYLERIRGRVAGVIIAGDYEGGAICTWEDPPSSSPNQPPIPYLDKFAVRTKSQGSGGVADIVWRCLTRQCFPDGVLWRSRSNNPVNKWYFERSVGTWKLPGGNWTMFWTTEGVVEEWAKEQESGEAGGGKWDAYVKVCEGVVPTWADGKRPD